MKGIKHDWLRLCYHRDNRTDPSAVWLPAEHDDEDIDENNDWIKSVLAEIPKIRPVFHFRKRRSNAPGPGLRPLGKMPSKFA